LLPQKTSAGNAFIGGKPYGVWLIPVGSWDLTEVLVRLVKYLSVLQVAGTLDPEFGGPPVAVNQLTRSLSQLGHTVDVVTLDSPSAPWLKDVPDTVLALGPGKGKYGYSRRCRRWLAENVQKYDVVVVHGLWRYQCHAVSQACLKASVPYFVFVHGTLDPWFKRRFPLKHVQKWLFWQLSVHNALSNAQAVIFTQVKERDLARQSFKPYRLHEEVVTMGIDEPGGDPRTQQEAFLSRFPDLRGKRILLFLSRIHPKKGCDLLIEAFARVAHVDERLHLVIAGPDEGDLERKLRELCEKLQITDRVTFPGMLSGDVKWGAYRAAEVFALISHSENFGIVLAESLACGLPVLTTDKVNISQEIEDSGGGLIGTDTVDSAESLMKSWLSMSEEERAVMQKSARSCYDEKFGSRNAALSFLQLVNASLGR
jgi:glycosyltransferase involved in cell wall biosynthesis